jgi:hypothetical protein
MAEYTAVLLEAAGIQEYIFSSNHLAQNVGASELVEQVSEEWLVETFPDVSIRANASLDGDQKFRLDEQQTLPEVDAEVIYRGGGKALVMFVEKSTAEKFIKKLSRKVIEQAPGLNLVVVYEQFDWEKRALASVHRELRIQLAARKLDRHFSAPLAGLGVTAKCVYTGMPAVGWDDDEKLVGHDAAERKKSLGEKPRLISAEVAAKLKAERFAQKRLADLIKDLHEENPEFARNLKEKFEFAQNFNDFGEKGTSSYIAVIHADGNGMGKRFSAIDEAYNAPAQNREYIRRLREFSESIHDRADHALKTVIKHLMERWSEYQFRPIVFGGDDVTFVCEGHLGLTIAAEYLRAYSGKPLTDGKLPYARAGVAVVKSHYPFSRAYDLAANQLAKEAKKKINALKQFDKESAAIMDWHFSTSGVELGLDEIRKREYTAKNGKSSLLMRPIRIRVADEQPESKMNVWRTWTNFSNLVEAFQTHDDWKERRNKIKALRAALRQGPEAVKLFLRNYDLHELPPIPEQPNMQLQGWQGDDCGYFDAIEAIDFFISFSKKTGRQNP